MSDPLKSDLLALHTLVFPLSLPFGRLPRRLKLHVNQDKTELTWKKIRHKDFQAKITPYYKWNVVDFERDPNLSTQKVTQHMGQCYYYMGI